MQQDCIVSSPRQFKSDGNIEAIDWMRVFAIISVVMFHIYQMTFMGNHLAENTRNQLFQLYYVPICCWLINIAMPLFMMISGYLFYYLIDKGKYQSWSELLKKKAVRLIVPYFVFAILMMATTNHANFSGLSTLYKGSYGVLWYLGVLLWCFMAGFCVKKLIHKPSIAVIIFVLSLVLQQMPKFLPYIFGLHNLTKWFCYFFYGGMVAVYNQQIMACIRKSYAHIWLLVIAVIIAYLYPAEYGEDNIAMLIYQFFALTSIWYITFYISNRFKIKSSWIVREISWNSFGIYIFHMWIGGYLIGNFAKRTFGIEMFAAGHPYLYPFMFFIITLSISFIISYYLRKTKVGRFLLG